MCFRTLPLALVTTAAVLATVSPASAQGCRSYPYRLGLDPDQLVAGKYLATASASVSFDDVDAVNDAREEATMQAKAEIVKFIREGIQSDQAIAKIVDQSKTMNQAGKENARKEAIRRVTLLRDHSQALLHGVVVLGDCYSKGSEVRVTVGVKPETLRAAEGLGDAMKPPYGAQNSQSNHPARQPLAGVDEYSNSDKVKNF